MAAIGKLGGELALYQIFSLTSDESSASLRTMSKSLLTVGNPKTLKGNKYGYATAILHLAPHKLSGHNVCVWASKGCSASCLNTAGRGGFGLDKYGTNTIQQARIERTQFFFNDRAGFMSQLADEIATHVRRSQRKGVIPVFRLNGTSDIRWERVAFDWQGERYPNVFAAFPEIQFYDYTKWPLNKREIESIPNYTLTFSISEREGSENQALEYLANGMNAAAVFRINTRKRKNPESLPESFIGYPVIDGDESDLRFLDSSQSIVGLRSKGRAFTDNSGFVKG